MYKKKKIAVIIPALNEEESLPYVLRNLPEYIDQIIVVDNGSKDKTFKIANSGIYHKNAIGVLEPQRGYGQACLKGMEKLKNEEIVVFLDADFSDDPAQIDRLLDPIIEHKVDFVVSNRLTTYMKDESMTWPQIFGSKLAVFLIRLLWGYRYFDLGPFRAIRKSALLKLKMNDKNYGWTIEMQVKAVKAKLNIVQVDVPYRKRIKGRSKIGGNFLGIIKAGYIFIYKIMVLYIQK